MQEYSAEDVRRLPRPVLERLADDFCEGHDETPSIPDSHDDVRHRDLFDAAPLAVDHDDIVHADRLRQRDLQAGQEILQHRSCGETDDQPGDPH